MLVITIKFLNGSYHATPWGKQVNEGVPEWPPSSWRFLRAIISTWKNTRSELKDEEILPILRKLAGEVPAYLLDDASTSHTKHYVPTTNNKSALIINTFVITGDKPVYIIWNNVTLSVEEQFLLEKLLKNLHYFGRAESWCTVSMSTQSLPSLHPNCIPLENQELSSQQDLVRVLVPNKDFDFVDLDDPKSINNDNLKSITITTRELQDKKYIDPPGGRWIQYVKPQNYLEGKLSTDNKIPILNNITLIRYAVVGTIRPHIKDTLRVGDLVRSACMSKYGKITNAENSSTFSGKNSEGKSLKGHMHAFYLPTYETQNQEIDHITIIASGSFDTNELDALFSLKRLYGPNTIDIKLLFQGCGTLDNFSNVPILQKSTTWISSTPLILTRHIKYRGKGTDKHVVDSPEEQIRNEIRQRYNSTYELKDLQIDESSTNIYHTNTKPIDFFRWRKHGSIGSNNAYKVKLEFREPVRGPITLGYASHFGLGMFVPLEDHR